jgi:hypothetical protein
MQFRYERSVVLVVILKYLFEANFSNDLNTDLILCLQKYYQSILFRCPGGLKMQFRYVTYILFWHGKHDISFPLVYLYTSI